MPRTSCPDSERSGWYVTRQVLDCYRTVFSRPTKSPDMSRAPIILPLVLLLSAIPALGQGLGSIVGTVVDPSGAAIGSAKVTATQAGTNFSRIAISEADGSFVLSSLNPAAYVLTIEASGFRLEKQNMTLLADQSLTANVKMQLGTANQVVEVQSNTLQVDTSTSTVNQVIEQQPDTPADAQILVHDDPGLELEPHLVMQHRHQIGLARGDAEMAAGDAVAGA